MSEKSRRFGFRGDYPSLIRYKRVEGRVEGSWVKRAKEMCLNRVTGLIPGYRCMGDRYFSIILTDIEEFKGFWSCCLLGCGGWGCSYLCRDGSGRNVVFKVSLRYRDLFENPRFTTKQEVFKREGFEKELNKLRDEVDKVKGLNHPNLVKLLGVHLSLPPILIYEYANQGSLRWQIDRGFKPSTKDAILIGIQIGEALRYIHGRGLVHGDVNPNNVFFNDNVAKLGDYSSIIHLLTDLYKLNEPECTPGFCAPEQRFREYRDSAVERDLINRVDVYQLGNVLLYLMIGETLDGVECRDVKGFEERLGKKLGRIKNDSMRNLIGRMLSCEVDGRPSSEDVVKTLVKIIEEI